MAGRMLSTALLLPCVLAASASLPVHLHLKRTVDSGLANIHVSFDKPISSEVTYTYGPCEAQTPGQAHHLVGRSKSCDHDRLLWKVPEYAPTGLCLSAWGGQTLVGRSAPVSISANAKTSRRRLKKRQEDFSIAMDNSSGIDAEGPWFDGVALLKDAEISAVNVREAKSKEVAIVGAGMAGLMTWLALNQSGMTNLTLIEAAQRLGGRVHTAYFGDPSDRQYQEMGPMRFPLSYTSSETNETVQIQDHRIVFQLAAEVNNLNKNNTNFTVDFIKWYQSSPNGLYYVNGARKPNGQVPTLSEVRANASLLGPSSSEPDDPALDAVNTAINALYNDSFVEQMARNIYRAHKTFLDQGLNGLGGDDFSEFAYVHNVLGYALNDTFVGIGDGGSESFWDNLYESMYFSATDWRTIDGGLTRLPSAFHPLVDGITHMNRKVQRVQYNETTQRVTLQWKNKPLDRTFQNASYDLAVVTVPMPLVRTWRLPAFSDLLSTAIDSYPYTQVCKVALQFKTRFWEHLDNPIYGSCSTTTDIPGIGSICYPSYDINSTGPGVMLASYTSGDSGLRWPSIPEDVHVQYVVDAMAEIHGQVVYNQYSALAFLPFFSLPPSSVLASSVSAPRSDKTSPTPLTITRSSANNR
jgi:monoamine oxidase